MDNTNIVSQIKKIYDAIPKTCLPIDYKLYYSNNHAKLLRIKKLLDDMDTNYFTKITFNEKILDESTVSIVMTSSNRSVQTYFTLETISDSIYKNIQIILVDDSTTDQLDKEKLKEFGIHIDFIELKNKFWINPCVNYNIGFRHVKGGKIIIQNAEVCHIGDVIKDVIDKVVDDNYYIYNVYALYGPVENNELYDAKKNKIMDPQHVITIYGKWYQHPEHRPANLHFLTAITAKTFEKITEFNVDYSIGIEFDDDDLVFRIIINNINIVNMSETIMGLHQWHCPSIANDRWNHISNCYLHIKKLEHFMQTGKIFNLTSTLNVIDTCL